MNLPCVSLIEADSYDLSILEISLEKLLLPLGGLSTFVNKGDWVLLKPNLLTASRPGKECITRPEIVYCIAKMVKALGGKPFIGDSPTFNSAAGVIKASEYRPLIAELDLPIVELHSKLYSSKGKTFAHLMLSQEAMEADVIINLPKVKSHAQVTLTLGVKNLFGCVPGKTKALWHMDIGSDNNHFATMLVETAQTISPNLTIIDGIIGHEGNGPNNGKPRHLGWLGASANVFALDRSIVDILNVDPASVPTLVAAQQQGLEPTLESIYFPLLHPQALKVNDWKLPSKTMPLDFGLPTIPKKIMKYLFTRLLHTPSTTH
ncbi:MAG: DUF362 domain-containing protein [Crocosphaera sp.]